MMRKLITFVLISIIASGCASLTDIPKKMGGTSRRTLEEAKQNSIYQVYSCDITACFDAVIEIATKANYNIFMKDRVRSFISLMNVPGVVDTTEVGVFLTEISNGKSVRVELSSRSSPAKKTAAKLLFSELSERFKK
ncbi:MAG: hypothetical protein HQL17_08020 [Candidatus Omnitrophica bacterium]|nr:hypothetical protein [Candidatus Omnitrophota bacterium]